MTNNRKSVLICDTQPVAVEGMKWLIENSGDLVCGGSVSTLGAVWETLQRSGRRFDAILLDKGLGLNEVMALLQRLAGATQPVPVAVWGASIHESEALRLLQAGARGIVRRTSESGTLLSCLRTVTNGGTWMEDGIFGSTEKLFNPRRSELTQRESEVVELVEKGLKNRDIAKVMGIKTGTVKIHLKHVFEKTGVRGRYGLAFTGLRERGSIAITQGPQVSDLVRQ